MLPLQGARIQSQVRELRSTWHVVPPKKKKKRGRSWTTPILSPIEKSLANLISSWKNTVTQWSSMLDFREVISEASCLHPLGLVWKEQQGRNHICLPNASVSTSYLERTVCLINNCGWINEWVSGNYFQSFKKPSATSAFARKRWYVPNKIAHCFPFLLEWYQLSVLMLSRRHAVQKLWLVPDDITVLISRTWDQINAILKSN